MENIVLGMGCFWGAEKRMAAIAGVKKVEVGYSGGYYDHPTYEKVLAFERDIQNQRHGDNNHAEVVRVAFEPEEVSVESVLKHFWVAHNPTQGDRQGNDTGSNYRSVVFYQSKWQQSCAVKTRDLYQLALTAAGFGAITTEIVPLDGFFTAESYHQHYLEKNPGGYCGLGGTGVSFPDLEPE